VRGKIGIAGYAGSGKSTAARLLAAALSTRVIDADREAKEFIAGNAAVVEKLIAVFGPSIAKSGILDFRILGTIVFSSAEQLQKYNAIVHPPFIPVVQNLIDSPEAVILDAALIPLWRIEPRLDVCIWVHADFGTRLARIGANRSDLDVSEIKIWSVRCWPSKKSS
jgi:dephospho-CoA kinase